jgi:hypothetical protein
METPTATRNVQQIVFQQEPNIMPTITITVDNKPVKVEVGRYLLNDTMRKQCDKFSVIGKNVFVDTASMKPERRLAEVDQIIYRSLVRNQNVLLCNVEKDLRTYTTSTKIRASPEELIEYQKYREALEKLARKVHAKKLSREKNMIRQGIQNAKDSLARSTKFLEKYKDFK